VGEKITEPKSEEKVKGQPKKKDGLILPTEVPGRKQETKRGRRFQKKPGRRDQNFVVRKKKIGRGGGRQKGGNGGHFLIFNVKEKGAAQNEGGATRPKE